MLLLIGTSFFSLSFFLGLYPILSHILEEKSIYEGTEIKIVSYITITIVLKVSSEENGIKTKFQGFYFLSRGKQPEMINLIFSELKFLVSL